MKKMFLLAAMLLGISVCANAQFDSAKDAAKAAQEACDVFGQKATSGTADNHTGVMRYGSSKTTESEHLGTQNHYDFKAQGEVKTGVVTKASAGVGGGFSRDGEQNNTRKTTTKDDSGYLYYKCEDE